MARTSYPQLLPLLAVASLCVGCATVPLDNARRQFNEGDLQDADATLANLPNGADRVLHLMERGMIRHLRQDYAGSTADWLEAVQLEKDLETHSVTRAGASMVVNDSLLSFRGYPYERTFLHVYLAKNYLARGMWEDAGVEGRSIALRMQNLDGFPDDAMSHYIAGFCLELCGDFSNAAMQYRQTAKLAPQVGLDERTGRFTRPAGSATNSPPAPHQTGPELVCFLDFDGCNGMMPEYAEVYANGRLLGTSLTLSDVFDLEIASSKRMELRKTAKTFTRLALKGAFTMYATSKNRDLGILLWPLLVSLEDEDGRRWETLPGKMAVIRAPCPDNLREFDVLFKSYSGISLRQMTVRKPITQRNRIFVSFCRDHP